LFDHEKLEVYRPSLDYVAMACEAAVGSSGAPRSTRAQLVRSSRSIPLSMAEGNGKRTRADRARFLDIAPGSAMQCAAAVDVLRRLNAMDAERAGEHKALIHRIVSMLVRLATGPARSAGEDGGAYSLDGASDYENDYEPVNRGSIGEGGRVVALAADGGAS